MSTIKNKIKKGDFFNLGELPTESVSIAKSEPDAIKEAISKKGQKTKAIIVSFGKKLSSSVTLLNTDYYGIDDEHPQFVRKIPNTPFCQVRSMACA